MSQMIRYGGGSYSRMDINGKRETMAIMIFLTLTIELSRKLHLPHMKDRQQIKDHSWRQTCWQSRFLS